MSNFTFNSNSDSTNLAVPKLCDNRNNWSNYKPHIQKAMGSKGLWRHVQGTAIAPKLYAIVNGIPVLPDGKSEATEEQVEVKETRIIKFDKQEYLAQHVILSTTSTCLGAKIKDMKAAKEMWDAIKVDAITKSTLYLLDTEDQLASMKLSNSDDPKTHLAELKQHFQLMLQCHNNLIQMGSTLSDSRFNTIIMSSLPESYRPTLQMITAAERTSTVLGTSSLKKMKVDDLIAFFIEDAQHHVINDECTKSAESALAAHGKKWKKGKGGQGKKPEKPELDELCDNCNRPGHTKPNCWSKGGGKEEQGPRQKKSKKGEKKDESASVAEVKDEELFAFTCTSDYVTVAEALQVPKS
ncbi:hypothetical protein PILCRDRAFT_11124 [Piloderma croceum F 1598]|uniref:CCHC-type domain-containing protein n=1 Tax=Piloderma croceum (strain F 1598) TaxID=765440 RepID=A0A0C3AWL7_PILCF|nr:hypothetical protein PILCRDRAFT_11124 [Piloderma croceum F 1598]